MTQEIKDLIAEAREWASSYASWGDNGLVDRLVDALEAPLGEPTEAHDTGMGSVDWDMIRDGVADPEEAASVAVRAALKAAGVVPVRGEPNDELIEYALDYIENGTMRPERREALRALAARASVPDAATEGLERAHNLINLREFEIDTLDELITELKAERDAALAEIESRIEDRDYWYGIANIAKSQRDAATEAIERVRAAKFEVDSVHQIHVAECLCGFSSARSRSRTEHITNAMVAAIDGGDSGE